MILQGYIINFELLLTNFIIISCSIKTELKFLTFGDQILAWKSQIQAWNGHHLSLEWPKWMGFFEFISLLTLFKCIKSNKLYFGVDKNILILLPKRWLDFQCPTVRGLWNERDLMEALVYFEFVIVIILKIFIFLVQTSKLSHKVYY